MSKCAQYDPQCDCGACEDDRAKLRVYLCRICNAIRSSDACTNGLCGECHRAVCTDGGATYPGHYIDRDRQAARLLALQA